MLIIGGEFDLKKNTLNLMQISCEKDEKVVVKPFKQDDMDMHDHDFFELAYVTGGCAIQNLDGQKEQVKKGDYFLIDYSARHGYQKCRDFTLINCLFLPEVIDEALEGCRSLDELIRTAMIRYYRKAFNPNKTANTIFHDHDGRVFSLLSGMQSEYEEKGFGYEEIFRCRLKEILLLMMREILQQASPYRQEKKTDQPEDMLISYIEKNFSRQAVLKHFCEEHHYSVSYISRSFKKKTGITAMQYVQKIRMEKCSELLLGSDLTLAEAAHAVGYDDMKFFNDIFRRTFGVTPGRYRKERIKTESYK